MTRLYILDTNHASHLIRKHDSSIRKHIRENRTAAIAISAITKAELLYGVHKNPAATHIAAAVDVFLRSFEVLPWTEQTADAYGKLRAALSASGLTLESMDLMIVAHALEHGAVLLSSDKVFARVPGLQCINWIE